MDVAASDQEINDWWSQLKEIDGEFELGHSDKIPQMKSNKRFGGIFEALLSGKALFLEIKKCGKNACSICKPPRLPPETFTKLQHFPDPIPKGDGYYKPFQDVLGTDTVEEHRPSLQKFSSREKRLPFYLSVQHVRNCNMMLICDECGMWRLVYAKRKFRSVICFNELWMTCHSHVVLLCRML